MSAPLEKGGWFLTALLLAAASTFAGEAPAPEASPPSGAWRPTAQARRGRFVASARTTGRLEPLKRISIRAAFSGTITFMWPEGTRVSKGQTILKIDTEDLERKITGRQDELDIARAEKAKAQQLAAQRLARAKLNVARATERVKITTLKLDLVEAGPTEDEFAESEKRLKSAELIYVNLQEEIQLLAELVEAGVETRERLIDLKLEFTQAQIDREKIRIQHAQLKARPEPVELREAELNLRLAKIDLENAQKQFLSVKQATQVQLDRHNAGIRKIEQFLRRDEAQLRRAVVKAPQDGIVLWDPGRWGWGWYPGRRAYSHARVMSLPNYDRMKVVTSIDEQNVRHLAQGTPAVVEIAAYPDQTFEGSVIRVAQLARDAFENLDSRAKELVGTANRQVFDVEIEILGETPPLLPGFRAACQIRLAELAEAVYVPRNAVFYEDAGGLGANGAPPRAYLRPAADPRRRRYVTLGLRNDRDVVITAGAQAGEVFLLTPDSDDSPRIRK